MRNTQPQIDAPANDTQATDHIELYAADKSEWVIMQDGWARIKAGDLVRLYLGRANGYVYDPNGFSVFMVAKSELEADNEYTAVLLPFAPVSTAVH